MPIAHAQIRSWRLFWGLSLLLALPGCQSAALHTASGEPPALRLSAARSGPGTSRQHYPALSKPIPAGSISLQEQTLRVQVQLPPRERFGTQALNLDLAEKITASVQDSHGKSYTPQGAVAGLVDYPLNGELNLIFENVVPDPLLFVSLQINDNSSSEIPQAELAAVLRHTTSGNASTRINFATTAVARTLRALLQNHGSPGLERARNLNLADLNTLLNSITGIQGEAPHYIYNHNHPSLVLTANLAADLLSTDSPALMASAASYRGAGATVNLSVSGLVGSDKIQVQLTDAASAVRTNLGNGASSGSPQNLRSTPGSGLRVLVSPFGSPALSYTYSITPATPLSLSEGGTQAVSIVATPNISISSFSPAAGGTGTSVTITGTGFTGATAVRFNGMDASSFTVHSDTQITATVPPGASDGPITVINGGAVNSASNFDVYRTIFVRADAAGSNNGTSWANAYTSLQSALSAATANDDLWIAAGTYTPGSPNTNRFQMKANVNIYGGFNGTETLRSQRDPAAHAVILSGDLNGDDDYTAVPFANISENSRTILHGANQALLDGVIVQGGHNTTGNGAGMLNAGASPTLNHVTFRYNTASVGGGMYNTSSSPTLTNISFSQNTAIAGGGMYNTSSSPTLTNVSFSQNTANNHGGGMFNTSSSPTLTHVSFNQNTASNNGGGMYNTSSSPTLTHVSFSQNTAGSFGGGMYSVSNSILTLNNAVFSQNTAQTSGGIFNFNSDMTLTNAVFSQNTASNAAGGMYNNGANPITLTHVTFFNNTATGIPSGGGILNEFSAAPVLKNVLFYLSQHATQNLGVGLGNLDASSDPFVNSASPNGPDGLPRTADDGLRLSSALSGGIDAGVSHDILGLPRNGMPEPGAYEFYE